MELAFEEKRHFPRIGLRTPLYCKIRGTGGCKNAISDNISLGGMGFTNDKFIAPKTTLVCLQLNILSRVLNPIGQIAWANSLPHSNKYQVGVEFLELDPSEKNYLKDFIDLQMGKIYT